MSLPACSLLIPCYNAARYLPRLLASVQAQTRPFAEIICYDDASSDDTVPVARGLGLSILSGPGNRGPAFARNRLAEAATCPWVHFHDADDLLDPHFVEKMSVRADAGTDVVICNALWQFASTRKTEMEWKYSDSDLAASPVSYLVRHPIGGINGCYRREIFRRIGGFDESLRTWEDADLHVRLAAAGARFAVVEEFLVIALRSETGISTDGSRRIECRARLLEHYADTVPAEDRAAVAAEAESLAAWLLGERQQPEVSRRCLAVCRKLDWPVPSSRNPLLRALRPLLPAGWLLALQYRLRRHHHRGSS